MKDPKTPTRAHWLNWFKRSTPKSGKDTRKPVKPLERLYMPSTGNLLLDEFLLIYGP